MIYINYVFIIIDFKQLFGNRLKTLPLHYHSRITFIRVLMMMMMVTFLRNKYAHCLPGIHIRRSTKKHLPQELSARNHNFDDECSQCILLQELSAIRFDLALISNRETIIKKSINWTKYHNLVKSTKRWNLINGEDV